MRCTMFEIEYWRCACFSECKWCYSVNLMDYLIRVILSLINGLENKWMYFNGMSHSPIWLWGPIKGLWRTGSACGSWEPASPAE